MELIERAGFLASLQGKFRDIETGEGHCVLVSGEAGMGKTSLVRAFCKEKKGECKIYQGTCDALFTPRPLAPLYDIAGQLNPGADIWQNSNATDDRAALFSRFFQELGNKGQVSIIVFEDVHWADEATLDFIKFLARRITRLNCLFILTCRNDEIGSRHPLRNVLGQLPPDSFTRLDLVPLSPGAVEAMAEARGYKGGDVYTISGGNPFYVNEILASYSPGIPDNIKDSILSVYNRQDEKTRQVWEILSVLPTGLEVKLLAALEPFYRTAIENCLDSKILVIKDELIFFKHELYRRTIETSLSPFVRVALNKRMLELFLGDPGHDGQLERIVHHAKNANEYEAVVQYAPLAARRAASVGAHTEAAKLYLSAIEYYQGNDRGTLVELYELYAYECYLTNKHKEAIIYTGRALTVWTQKNDRAKMGNCMRFLSRLWWYEGNRKQSESYGNQSIEVFETLPASKAKAMAYSNMSQLMLSVDRAKDCIKWAKESIALAHEAGDEETLSHSLTNMGTTLSLDPATRREGIDLLEQSLSIALKNAYHEHAARVYAILGANGVTIKDYDMAKTALAEGIAYCEENNLDAQRFFMLSSKARMLLETGDWE
ncbi:MAG TPA: AAA family ATPase, partial [Mucilaginibacter sp.]|nr:AAA family ATPase [Mucilaginibacter sp.]